MSSPMQAAITAASAVYVQEAVWHVDLADRGEVPDVTRQVAGCQVDAYRSAAAIGWNAGTFKLVPEVPVTGLMSFAGTLKSS